MSAVPWKAGCEAFIKYESPNHPLLRLSLFSVISVLPGILHSGKVRKQCWHWGESQLLGLFNTGDSQSEVLSTFLIVLAWKKKNRTENQEPDISLTGERKMKKSPKSFIGPKPERDKEQQEECKVETTASSENHKITKNGWRWKGCLESNLAAEAHKKRKFQRCRRHLRMWKMP